MRVAVHLAAGGALASLVPRNDTGALIVGSVSGLVSGVLTALVIAFATREYRRFRPPRRVGYDVLSNRPIGQASATAGRRWPYRWLLNTRRLAVASSTPRRTMWRPAITDREGRPVTDEDGRPITVENASQVEIEIRHIGREPIETGHFQNQPVTVCFPGRMVMDFQVVEVSWARLLDPALGGGGAAPIPGESDSFTLPPWPMNPHESFTLEVLLTDPRPSEDSGLRRPTVTVTGHISGGIPGGGFKRYRRRVRRWLTAAIAMVVALVVGVVVALVVSGGSRPVPGPFCVSGSVSFKGSTAFAPIVNEVAALYERYCPGAQIGVRAIGSGQGLIGLNRQKRGAQFVAMYDGKPPQGLVCSGCMPRPVGVVIFAVVGNKHLWPSLFEKGHGMSRRGITRAFTNPQLEAEALQVPWVDPAGRTTVSWKTPSGRSQAPSGTRQAFIQNVLLLGGHDTPAETNVTKLCPTANKNTICLAKTTMDMLAYLNSKYYSIGYAEADALIYFPNVGAIPIKGVLPTRANALNGSYGFVATEYLYTQGKPTGLAAAFIKYLTSNTVTTELRDQGHLFIACSDLRGSALAGRCGADRSRR